MPERKYISGLLKSLALFSIGFGTCWYGYPYLKGIEFFSYLPQLRNKGSNLPKNKPIEKREWVWYDGADIPCMEKVDIDVYTGIVFDRMMKVYMDHQRDRAEFYLLKEENN
jgi:hypothetical protein